MDRIPRLSEAVYVGLSQEVGTCTEVSFRREITDIKEVVTRSVCIRKGLNLMKSGSEREGFRLRTSDVDFMLWPLNHKVICEFPQTMFYLSQKYTLILMEPEEVPPGFTRLRLLTKSHNEVVRSSCVNVNNQLYIFSSLYRGKNLQLLRKNSINPLLASSIEHGPCATYKTINQDEVDIATCLQCPHWPSIASLWLHRCVKKKWPDQSVLTDILNKGCHVVPISSGPSCSDKNSEWRISFSVAEQKLVYSMNHCQFLCYGLLKIFMKEVVNSKSNNTILCSYFMKTILFWAIQNEGSLNWTPCTILVCFWKCFRILIHLVHKAECPNFFIPQNNMFRLKVSGAAQSQLFSQLYDLYCMGMSCLLLSPSLGPYLNQAIIHKTPSIRTDESRIISSHLLSNRYFTATDGLHVDVDDLIDFISYVREIEKLLTSSLTSFQVVAIQSITSKLLVNTAFFMQKYLCTCINISNKDISYLNHISVNLLRLVSKIGYVSDILYICTYLYRSGRYHQSLRYLQKALEKVSFSYILFSDRGRRVIEGLSLSDKMRKVVRTAIKLHRGNTYLEELMLEQTVSPIGALFVHPEVMLFMLLTLNHNRLGDTIRSQQCLQGLQSLLRHNVGDPLLIKYRDLSWQILGICQQICGDYLGAFHSFQCSLQQYPHSRITRATIIRLCILLESACNNV